MAAEKERAATGLSSQAIWHRRSKIAALAHYSKGTPKCGCCGELKIEFLSIDHIDGGGAKHRKELSTKIYSWLKARGYPPGYRVLCHNCNQSLGAYGYCPHVTPVEFVPELTLAEVSLEAKKKRILNAAVALDSTGLSPSLNRLVEATGLKMANICVLRRKLLSEGKWPFPVQEKFTPIKYRNS